MPPQINASRVEGLEKRVTRLEELPGRIDDLTSQVSQLRTEMRDEFSAVRTEMAAGFAAVALTTDKLEAKTDGLATQMRMLHEDVIARIALLQEGLTGSARRKSKKKYRQRAPLPLRCLPHLHHLTPRRFSRVGGSS